MLLGQCVPLREYPQQIAFENCNKRGTPFLSVFIYVFIFGTKLLSPSEKKAEVATVTKRTVNSAVFEMCKQATEAGSQRVTCVGGREALLADSGLLEREDNETKRLRECES